jgi:prepilin-type N-terminal cleavage/methylation domain-containing protein
MLSFSRKCLAGIPQSTNESRSVALKSRAFLEAGFSMIELLVVISIIGLLSYLVVPGLVALNQAGNIRAGTVQINDLLEQAYSSALSKNTYVWVGFSQLNGNGGGVAMASVFSAHANPNDFPNSVSPLTRPVFLPKLSLATITTQIASPNNRATTSVGEITGANWGTFSTSIAGVPQTLSYVMEITPSGQVSLSSTNKYAWMEIGIAPLNGTGKNVSLIQMNAFTGRVSTYQP